MSFKCFHIATLSSQIMVSVIQTTRHLLLNKTNNFVFKSQLSKSQISIKTFPEKQTEQSSHSTLSKKDNLSNNLFANSI